MSGMDVVAVGNDDTSTAGNGTFHRLSPTWNVTSASSSSSSWSRGRGGGSVQVYVCLFLGLLLLLLSLLLVALHRLKNIVSSSSSSSYTSSSLPDCGGEGRFTNMEVCSVSSRTSPATSLRT
ncbi:serine-rich and transmembrane domain-containing protein 1 [Nerophis lumbriciformis]|uniref:serine-rich and transmembrane domain-containing protein 1 n=1 Tax=Nerophis lumbriciformis TaxID=546530 RepID=UPI002ADF0150|nr:serine rich and transmembrane domain containing 1 [Nerophis lumbriciformis]XP_061787460.1 serine rich and transmembrane domain containing 1 [Nerophis lumbriciformis]XP_061787461.1 serine rich and transmembrane domain containing 1 [Nerophis lumbriciformis]